MKLRTLVLILGSPILVSAAIGAVESDVVRVAGNLLPVLAFLAYLRIGRAHPRLLPLGRGAFQWIQALGLIHVLAGAYLLAAATWLPGMLLAGPFDPAYHAWAVVSGFTALVGGIRGERNISRSLGSPATKSIGLRVPLSPIPVLLGLLLLNRALFGLLQPLQDGVTVFLLAIAIFYYARKHPFIPISSGAARTLAIFLSGLWIAVGALGAGMFLLAVQALPLAAVPTVGFLGWCLITGVLGFRAAFRGR